MTESTHQQRQAPVSFKTYHQTIHWVTRAVMVALQPLVGKDKSEYPSEIVLDNLLSVDPEHPDYWINPTQETIGPIRPRIEGQDNRGWLARKNGFFRALRAWRPNEEVEQLGLDTKYKVEYVLDKVDKNQYLHTVIKLSDDGYDTVKFVRRQQESSEIVHPVPTGGRGRGRGRGGRGRGGPYNPQHKQHKVTTTPTESNPNSWANRVKSKMTSE